MIKINIFMLPGKVITKNVSKISGFNEHTNILKFP